MTTARSAVELTRDSQGLATLTFDLPDRSVNVFNLELMAALEKHLRALAGEPGIKGIILRSAKPTGFFAGANVEAIAEVSDRQRAEEQARAGQAVFNRLAQMKVPAVAAIHGLCLGGGLELALACRYRVASEARETRLGLPEVRLGLIPAWGGATRLPRLIGLPAALDLILTGRTVSAQRAQQLGLVDRVVPQDGLDREARLVLETLPPPASPPRWSRLARWAPGMVALIAWRARRGVFRQAGDHYPAPLKAVEVVQVGVKKGVQAGLDAEARAIGELLAGPVAHNLIRLFLLRDKARGMAKSVADKARPVRELGVLGAGQMGGGIAYLLARHELPARVKDIRAEALDQALQAARDLLSRDVARGRLAPQEADEVVARIQLSLEYTGFETLDVVVEAVVEDLSVKQTVLREVEDRGFEGVFATNTSALSVTHLAQASKRPGRVVGMHFFNPVHRMELVEVVRGDASEADTISTVLHLSHRLGKVPILVRDRPGFLVNRLLMPYLQEAVRLVMEGWSVEGLDQAVEEFGMPMGPLTLLDTVGIPVAHHVAEIGAEAFPERLDPPTPLATLLEVGRKGKAAGAGFYRYEDGNPRPDPAIREVLRAPEGRAGDRGAALDRMILTMINEAAYVIAEDVVEAPETVDLAMVLGTGFAPFRGGPLRYAQAQGLESVVRRLEELQAELGPRFAPAPLLREWAEKGGFAG